MIYVADEVANDVFEMFSIPTTGGARVKLNGALATGGDVVANAITFSPDSAGVVYAADQLTDDVFELFSVPVVGGVNTRLNAPFAADRDSTRSVRQSPTRRVVFRADQDTNDVFELYSVPILGGATSKLNGPLVADGAIEIFKVSPDGSRVVYSASQNVVDRFELFSVPLSGGAVSAVSGALVSGGSVNYNFVFSPDSRQVLYVADQDVDEVNELYISLEATVQPSPPPPTEPTSDPAGAGTIAGHPPRRINVRSPIRGNRAARCRKHPRIDCCRS